MLLSSAWADRKVPILQHFFISPTYNLLHPNFARSYRVIFLHFHFLEKISFSIQDRFHLLSILRKLRFPLTYNLQLNFAHSFCVISIHEKFF